MALHQARAARVQQATAQSVEKFLLDIFNANSGDQADPVKAQKTTARELLDLGAGKIDGELTESPEAKFHILGTLAGLYNDIGLKERGVELHRKRVALARNHFGTQSAELAQALVEFALNLPESSAYKEIPGVLKEAGRILDSRGDSNSLTRAGYYRASAALLLSTDMVKSGEHADKAIEILRQYPVSGDLLRALRDAGAVARSRVDFAQAAAYLEEASAVARTLGGKASSTLPSLGAYLGDLQFQSGDYAAAERSYREGLSAARRYRGKDHEDVIQTQFRLGVALAQTGRFEEGLRELKEAYELSVRTKGDDDFHTPTSASNYGRMLLRYGSIEEGKALIERAMEKRRRRRGTRLYAQTLSWQAWAEFELGHFEKAAPMLDESLAIMLKPGERTPSPDARLTSLLRVKMLLSRGAASGAATVMSTIPEEKENAGRLSFAELERRTVQLDVDLASNKPDEAQRRAAGLRRYIQTSTHRQFWQFFEMKAALGEGRALLARGEAEKALPQLELALTMAAKLQDRQRSPLLSVCLLETSRCLARLGQLRRAQQLQSEAAAIQSRYRDLAPQYRALSRQTSMELNRSTISAAR